MIIMTLSFQNIFRPHLNARLVFSNSPDGKAFSKSPVFVISVDGRPNRRNKAAFSNVSGVE